MIRFVLQNDVTANSGPAIFLDRDGVINCRRPNDYVLEWNQFVFVPGIQEALRELSTLNLPIIVVSNQAAVGKRLLSPQNLAEITARMQEVLLRSGVRIAACYYCPHKTEERCACRKPGAEMLRKAAADFDIQLRQSILIGDSDTDIQAARAVGCQPVLFDYEQKYPDADSADWRVGLPTARSAREIYPIAVNCLQADIPYSLPKHR